MHIEINVLVKALKDTFEALVYKKIACSEYFESSSLFICHISNDHSFITSLEIFVLSVSHQLREVYVKTTFYYMEKLSFCLQTIPTFCECGRYLELMSWNHVVSGT